MPLGSISSCYTRDSNELTNCHREHDWNIFEKRGHCQPLHFCSQFFIVHFLQQLQFMHHFIHSFFDEYKKVVYRRLDQWFSTLFLVASLKVSLAYHLSSKFKNITLNNLLVFNLTTKLQCYPTSVFLIINGVILEFMFRIVLWVLFCSKNSQK